MLKIDITKPIHAVARCLWEGSTASRAAKVLCLVPGSKCHAVVQIDGYSSPMIFDLSSGFVQGALHYIENAPPKMVKKNVTLYTAVMRSSRHRIFVVSRVDEPDNHNKEIQKRIKGGSTLLYQFCRPMQVEFPEELSAPT